MKRRRAYQATVADQAKQASRMISVDCRPDYHGALPGLAKLTVVATYSNDPTFSLAPEEAAFLRWLRENGGTGTRSGTNWMNNDVRLVRAGYVGKSSSDMNTATYSLAPSGEKALIEYDAATEPNQFAMSEWPGQRVKPKQTQSGKHRRDTDVPGYDSALRQLRSYLT